MSTGFSKSCGLRLSKIGFGKFIKLSLLLIHGRLPLPRGGGRGVTHHPPRPLPLPRGGGRGGCASSSSELAGELAALSALIMGGIGFTALKMPRLGLSCISPSSY